MANTFVTLQEIARQALPRLMDNLVFPNLIYRDYMEEAHEIAIRCACCVRWYLKRRNSMRKPACIIRI